MYYFITCEIKHKHRRNERRIVDVFERHEKALNYIREHEQAVRAGEECGYFGICHGKKNLDFFFCDKTEMKTQLEKFNIKY